MASSTSASVSHPRGHPCESLRVGAVEDIDSGKSAPFDPSRRQGDSGQWRKEWGMAVPSVQPAIANNCCCGRPWERVGGKHVCRLFGKFECVCGKSWTSAYCWYNPQTDEYEKQACRACERESLPIRAVERERRSVNDRIGANIAGPHDSARCAMCQKLGYNCSGY